MTTKAISQQNNHFSLTERGRLFIELGMFIDRRLSKDEAKERLKLICANRGIPEVYQNAIDGYVDRFWEWTEEDPHIHDKGWEEHWQEFRIFLRRTGIRLGDFDRAMRKSVPRGRHRLDFRRFLTSYYLIAVGKNPAYAINGSYQIVMENAWELFEKEVRKISAELCLTIEGEGSLVDYEGRLLGQDISILKSCLLPFLIYHSRNSMIKANGILSIPYICGEPSKWLAYLFGLQGDEICPILRRILEVLLDEVMGTEQVEKKPLVWSET